MIAREGLHLIFIGLVLTAGFILLASRYDNKILFGLSIFFGVLTLFTIFFFRDPARQVNVKPNCLVSPADGRILAVEEIMDDPHIGGKALKVSIFLSVFDVHVNRVPVSGKIDYVKYNPGKFFSAFKDKASHFNEQTEIGMTAATGHKIIFKQIAGSIARRIVCYLHPGDDVISGARFGMIRFGSRTELIVPDNTSITVKVGDHVKGAESVIGYLPAENLTPQAQSNGGGDNVQL